MQIQSYGVDVCAKYLDIASSQDSPVRRISNSVNAIEGWLDSIATSSVIAMEVTNSYHLALAQAAHQAGHTVYVLNPMDMKHYAKGVGRRTKNDKVDARLICRYVQHEQAELRAWQPMTENQAIITSLFNRRGTLVRHRQAIAMACKHMPVELDSIAKALDALQQVIDEMERKIIQVLRQQQRHIELLKLFQSIPGFGSLTSAYLTNLFSRIQFDKADQLVSFLGLDLAAADSGQKISRRRLTKRGPAEARRVLYGAAMSASRGYFKPMYEHYCERLTKTQALVALMRKLVTLAYGVWKSQTCFSPSRYKSPLMAKAV